MAFLEVGIGIVLTVGLVPPLPTIVIFYGDF